VAGYDAFVSYSHAADGRLAPAVQRGLQRLAKPWYRVQALRVFHDDSALTADPHLWKSIATVLDDSAWFVLLASPAAATSEWVDRELREWLGTHSTDRVLVVLSDGSWSWDPDRAVLRGDAVPAALVDAFAEEPRHVDLSWARDDTQLDLRNPRFRDAVAQIAAPVHGVPRDELESEDVRQHRRARRLARAAVAALTVLLVAAIVFGAFAFVQRERAVRNERAAEANARLATAERLAAQAQNVFRADPALAMLLAAEGFGLRDQPSTRQAMLLPASAPRSYRVATQRGFSRGTVIGGALGPDGQRGVICDAKGSRLQTVRDGRVTDATNLRETCFHNTAPGDDPVFTARANYVAAFSPDGRLIATNGGDDGSIRIRDARTGAQRGPALVHGRDTLTAAGGYWALLAFSPDGRLLASASQTDASLYLWSTTDRRLRHAPIAVQWSRDLAFSRDSRFVVVGADDGVVIVDLEHGDVARRASSSRVTAVAFGHDSRSVLVGTSNGALQRLALGDGRAPRELGRPGAPVVDIACSPDGTQFTVLRADGSAQPWDAATSTPLGSPIDGFNDPPVSVQYTATGTLVAVASTEITHINVGTALLRDRVPVGADGDAVIAASADGSNVVVGDAPSRSLAVVDGASGRAVGPRYTTSKPVTATGVNSGRARYLYVEHDRDVEVVDARRGRRVRVVRLARTDVVDDVAPDGRLLLHTPGRPEDLLSSQRFDVVSPASGARVQYIAFEVHASAFTRPQFAPDGGTVLLAQDGYGEPAWKVYELGARSFATTARHVFARTHPFTNGVVRMNRSGTVVAAAHDNQIDLLEPSKLRASRSVFESTDVRDLALSDDGDLLAVVDGSRRVTLWDTASHEVLGSFSFTGSPRALAFLGHPASALVVSDGAKSTVLDLRPAAWRAEACRVAGRQLTRAEWAQYMRPLPYRPRCRSAG
jgi:WD40 repeat protein